MKPAPVTPCRCELCLALLELARSAELRSREERADRKMRVVKRRRKVEAA